MDRIETAVCIRLWRQCHRMSAGAPRGWLFNLANQQIDQLESAGYAKRLYCTCGNGYSYFPAWAFEGLELLVD